MRYSACKQRLGAKARIENNEAHVEQTVALAREAYARRKADVRIGFFAFCLRQIGFFAWQTWSVQAIVLVCLYAGLRLSLLSSSNALYLSAPFVLRVSAVVIALSALPTLYRSSKHRMLEVEVSARVGYARLLLSRLALVGVGDALMLAGMLFFAVLYANMGLINALFCLLLPFIMTLAAFLLLLPRVPLRALPSALFAIGIAMLIATAALGSKLPDARLYPVWGTLGILLMLLCATQLVALKRQGGFADVQFS